MKYLHKYNSFLLERFDIQKYYQQNKTPKLLQYYAKETLSKINTNNIPSDLKGSTDKVEFWIAKSLKIDLLKIIEELKTKTSGGVDGEYIDDKIYNMSGVIIKKSELLDILNKDVNSPDDYDKNNKAFVFLGYLLHNSFDKKLTEILEYIFSPARNPQLPLNLINSTFDQMYEQQKRWHAELKASGNISHEEGNIIKKFDDGFYWIDLETSSSKEEANAMGHCGTSHTADTLISLRDRTNAGIRPHVTIAVDYDDSDIPTYSILKQIKGKQNKKPIEKYHSYIVDLLCDKNIFVDPKMKFEYNTNDDFHLFDLTDDLLINKVIKEIPDLFLSEPFFNIPEDKIKKFCDTNPEIIENCTDQYNLIKFLKMGLINNNNLLEKMNPKLKDLVIYDDKLYMSIDDLSDFYFMFDDSRRREYNYKELFKNTIGGDWDYGYRDSSLTDSKYSLDDIDDENLKTIWDLCKKYNQSVLDGSFEIPEIEEFKLLRKNYNKFLDFLKELDYDELNDAIRMSVDDAQESADQDQAYDICIKPVKDFFGINVNEHFEHKDGKYIIPINYELLDWMMWSHQVESYPQSSILGHIENWFMENTYNEDHDKLEIDIHYYGYYGQIDKETLNDRLSDKLSEIKHK
jgi:hypothetical protein